MEDKLIEMVVGNKMVSFHVETEEESGEEEDEEEEGVSAHVNPPLNTSSFDNFISMF